MLDTFPRRPVPPLKAVKMGSAFGCRCLAKAAAFLQTSSQRSIFFYEAAEHLSGLISLLRGLLDCAFSCHSAGTYAFSLLALDSVMTEAHMGLARFIFLLSSARDGFASKGL